MMRPPSAPEQADQLRELVELRKKALIESLPEQDSLREWVSVRRFNPSGKSSFNHDRPANWQGISSMPGPGRTYRSGIVKLTASPLPPPAAQLLGTTAGWGIWKWTFPGKAHVHRKPLRQEGKQALGRL